MAAICACFPAPRRHPCEARRAIGAAWLATRRTLRLLPLLLLLLLGIRNATATRIRRQLDSSRDGTSSQTEPVVLAAKNIVNGGALLQRSAQGLRDVGGCPPAKMSRTALTLHQTLSYHDTHRLGKTVTLNGTCKSTTCPRCLNERGTELNRFACRLDYAIAPPYATAAQAILPTQDARIIVSVPVPLFPLCRGMEAK